jgi:hypothetical protein
LRDSPESTQRPLARDVVHPQRRRPQAFRFASWLVDPVCAAPPQRHAAATEPGCELGAARLTSHFFPRLTEAFKIPLERVV